MSETVFGTIFLALTGAITVMWASLKADHKKLVKLCEDQGRRLTAIEPEMAVYVTCPADECPAREAVAQLRSHTGYCLRRMPDVSKIVVLCLLLLTSCTMRPFIRQGENVVSLGGSMMSKTTGETVSYNGPLGTVTYSTGSTDETVIPGKISNYYGIKAAISGSVSMLKTTETTRRILSGHKVQKAATDTAASVEKLRILHPQETP
jgi:hypothetical protein